MSEFFLEKRIYYHDTDCGGIVYYSTYLDHLEEARTEYMRKLGVDVGEYAAKGVLFAVVHLEADYKCPAKYGDVIKISAGVESVGNASIHFVQEVKKADALLMRSKVVLACIDNKMKARRIPEEMKEKLGYNKSEG